MQNRSLGKNAPSCSIGFLTQLPEDVRACLLSRAEMLHLPSTQILYRSREVPRHVHFLMAGVASIMTVLADGRAMEVGLIGCEGVPEYQHLAGSAHVSTEALMQVGGTALRVPFPDVRRLLGESTALQAMVMDQVQRHGLISQQLAACNHFHELISRLARWLLMLEDRVGEPVFSITQEALATMIGARRPTLTVAAGKLQKLGLVEYDRGIIRVVDRKGLEHMACECYAVVRELNPAISDGGSRNEPSVLQ